MKAKHNKQLLSIARRLERRRSQLAILNGLARSEERTSEARLQEIRLLLSKIERDKELFLELGIEPKDVVANLKSRQKNKSVAGIGLPRRSRGGVGAYPVSNTLKFWN